MGIGASCGVCVSIVHNLICKFVNRNTDHGSEDVEPACKLTLKNLQLEYLDLYLVHSPSSLAKGTLQLTEESKLGYDPARMAETWKVGNFGIFSTFVHHYYLCFQLLL